MIENLKLHKLQHLSTQTGINDLNVALAALSKEQKKDLDKILPISVMSQVNTRLRQDSNNNKSLEVLELRVGMMETCMGPCWNR